MDLSTISCLRDSDCSFGLSCQDWQCRPATARARTRKRIRWLADGSDLCWPIHLLSSIERGCFEVEWTPTSALFLPSLLLLPAVIKKTLKVLWILQTQKDLLILLKWTIKFREIDWCHIWFHEFFDGERCDSYCWIVGHYFDFCCFILCLPNFLLIASLKKSVYMCWPLLKRLRDPDLKMLRNISPSLLVIFCIIMFLQDN